MEYPIIEKVDDSTLRITKAEPISFDYNILELRVKREALLAKKERALNQFNINNEVWDKDIAEIEALINLCKGLQITGEVLNPK